MKVVRAVCGGIVGLAVLAIGAWAGGGLSPAEAGPGPPPRAPPAGGGPPPGPRRGGVPAPGSVGAGPDRRPARGQRAADAAFGVLHGGRSRYRGGILCLELPREGLRSRREE